MVIGFNQTLYEVSESEPFALMYVMLSSGTLRREVIVNVSTLEDTALGTYLCACLWVKNTHVVMYMYSLLLYTYRW